MAAVRASTLGLDEKTHYGRPFAWHQQAAKRNFLAAWADLPVPVLVIFNRFDQYEGRHGHALIAETVNRLRPGTAQYVEQPAVGHSNRAFPTIDAAYAGENGDPAWSRTAGVLLDWLAARR